ncbi:ribonucleotide-diphosphate reductase subunit alpha [Cohnella kolymensis]|uniref:Ribonucleoside-diphosphate reductase n=1 Tax=Cohnella kolymensis TaxID=1590652 RepID=A0ABR5A282_9BACL|nr:ribonucleoside-diphosphate reductase subunit alpha [Cohnella kolymensis]KIL35105.1 ribonucleotide-diphosphate reductase subunit alpha [Cohnella kolymensis]KIL36514.1 ribonucleotide-diphosphate reductase subunit alpha [Cohnella kolymensis]
MIVVKRNGQTEEMQFAKFKKVIDYAMDGSGLSDIEMEEALLPQLKDRMSTKQIQRILIQTATEKISVEQPQWEKVAAKLYLYDLYKEAAVNRGYGSKSFGYGSFYDLVQMLTQLGLYGAYVRKAYKKSEIEELGRYIKPERDELFTYVGVKTLAERYCVRGFNKEVYELPQEAFMGVAMAIAAAEKPGDRVRWAKEFYDVMSLLQMTAATPTMSNARKPYNQMSSCFIGTMDDSLESIFHVVDQFSQVSKYGGGMGIYIGKVRAANSDIRGFKGTSGGVIPWARIINDTAVACNQLGMRSGAVSVTLDIWHRDIWEFLNLKTNNGDERRKAHDIFPAISIPDVFMRQLKKETRVRDGKFYLMCPHEIRSVMGWSLEDCYDETEQGEFTRRYWQCVDHPDLKKEEVLAIDLLKAIIKSDTETGTPFQFYRDSVNRMNPNKHAGMIYSSNLCMEINQNMSASGPVERRISKDRDGNEYVAETRRSGDFVVCNLGSLNLGRLQDEQSIAKVVPVVIRMLDNVITVNHLPVKQAEQTNSNYRSIGLGTFGYHHMLAIQGIQWESEEHVAFADRIYEAIAYHAIKASCDLAREKGAYPLFSESEWATGAYFERREYTSERWKALAADVAACGLRNAYLMAVAPNGSSSQYGGSTQSIDPIYARFYLDEKKNAVIPIIAPDLNADTFWLYKEAHLIDQSWSIRACAARQRHIDQSQSFNLYITPQTKAADIAQFYVSAWEQGVKTLYYTRSRSVEVEDCAACSA